MVRDRGLKDIMFSTKKAGAKFVIWFFSLNSLNYSCTENCQEYCFLFFCLKITKTDKETNKLRDKAYSRTLCN